MSTSRKPTVALGWFPLNAATESAILDMANSRQIALRTRLRNHYWLTEGKPIGAATVAIVRKKMTMIDLRDVLSDEEVSEVLSDHYGFTANADGWTIPDLDEARGVAIGAIEGTREKLAEGGRKRAATATREGGRFVSAAALPVPGASATDF